MLLFVADICDKFSWCEIVGVDGMAEAPLADKFKPNTDDGTDVLIDDNDEFDDIDDDDDNDDKADKADVVFVLPVDVKFKPLPVAIWFVVFVVDAPNKLVFKMGKDDWLLNDIDADDVDNDEVCDKLFELKPMSHWAWFVDEFSL